MTKEGKDNRRRQWKVHEGENLLSSFLGSGPGGCTQANLCQGMDLQFGRMWHTCFSWPNSFKWVELAYYLLYNQNFLSVCVGRFVEAHNLAEFVDIFTVTTEYWHHGNCHVSKSWFVMEGAVTCLSNSCKRCLKKKKKAGGGPRGNGGSNVFIF